MTHIVADRVKETTTTTGTGALTLAGAATGFRAFSSVMSANDTCFYAISASGSSEWEVGVGTYNTTLTRTTVLSSSNAGAAVNLSAGTKDVYITEPASGLGMQYFLQQTADYALTSTVSQQKIFNEATNGTLALPTGVYRFDAFIYLLTMSATSGNASFDLKGGGSDTIDRWGHGGHGIDNSAPLNAGTQTGSHSVTVSTVASAVSAGTGQGAVWRWSGMFRVSAAGTIIPSLSLVTANAATVKAGSWIEMRRVGESSVSYSPGWS